MRKSDGVRTEQENIQEKRWWKYNKKKNQDFLLKLKGNFIFGWRKIMF